MDHRTAMPSRNHPEPPEGLHFTTGVDPYEYENEQTHPGWAHRQIYAHLPDSEHGRPDGILNYSATPDGHPHPTVAIHMIKTYGDRGRGVGSAMMDELRGQHPAHMFDHGAKSPSGQAFLDKYEDPAGPHMNLDHPANASLEDLHRPTDEAKWRARKNLDFMGILRTAARDRELGFEVTASWADVQRKAKRIRAEGGVTIVIASNDGIGGQVKGDRHTYEAILVFRPGTHKVADWTCGCAWAAYAFDRSPAFKHFEGRKCSHALALQFEAQSQGMFGKEIHPAEPARKVPTVVKYDPDDGQSVFARPYEGSLAAVAVTRLREDGVDPGEIIGTLIQTGMKHAAARELWKTAHVEEGHHEAALDVVDAGKLGAVLAASREEALSNLQQRSGGDGALWHEQAHQLMAEHGMVGHGQDSYSPTPDQFGVELEDYEPHAHHLGPDEPVHSGQQSLNVPRLGEYLHGKQGEGPVVTVRHQGKTWVHDGTHRTLADRMSDRQGVDTLHFNLDGPRRPGAKPAWWEDESEHNWHHEAAKGEVPGPKVSGIALKAHDTGRVLMLQRGLEDEKDPAAGTWEFPGGHHEDGDLTSLHAGIREWQEEVGQPFPDNGAVKHTWTSPNGVYQGHVVVIPSEKDLSMKDGRVTVNPDDPKGDHHEQAAWWSVEHAKKNPALRPEVKANTPWKDIDRASLDTAKTASSWDPISNTTVSQPGRNLSEPEHSTSKNPVSTGFATSDDPSNWDNLDASPVSLTTNMSFDSTLHAQPEPALPSTDGDRSDPLPPGTVAPQSDRETMPWGYDDLPEFREDHPEVSRHAAAEYHPEISQEDLDPVPDDPAQPDPYQLTPGITLQDGGSATPNTYHSSRTAAEIVADFQKSAAAQALMMPTDTDTDDIAAAARAHLSKSALADFSPAEQRELINEGTEDARARNFGDLKIDGTHYALLEEAMLNGEVDPSGLFL